MTWTDTSELDTPLTVARLVERRVALRWHEAVAIVLEVADVFQRSGMPSVPRREELSLNEAGTIEFAGSANRTGDPVTALADTLGALLPLLPKEPPTQLQLIASTAGPNSVSYKSVEEFAEALGYFERPGRHRILAEVYRRTLVTPAGSSVRQSPNVGSDTSSQGAPIRMLATRDIVLHEAVDTGEIRQLVESVRQFGVLQPLLVRRAGAGYELVAGARRFAAARVAGLTEVPCRVSDVGSEDDREDHDAGITDDVRVAVKPTRDSAPSSDDVRAAVKPTRDSAPSSDDVRAAVKPTRDSAPSSDDVRAAVKPTRDSAPSSDVVLGPALGEIADSLRAATSCWRLSVEGPDRPYSRTVNEVTRAELQRATWVVEALQVLTQRPVVTKVRVNVGTVLEQVFRATEPERRLTEVKLSASLAQASVIVRGDERLLIMAVGGVLQALVALVSEVTPATIHCSVGSRSGAVVIELSQESVIVPPSLMARFFDETCHGRPGGYGAAVALAAAQRVFELHGGGSKVESDGRGCRVALTLPA